MKKRQETKQFARKWLAVSREIERLRDEMFDAMSPVKLTNLSSNDDGLLDIAFARGLESAARSIRRENRYYNNPNYQMIWRAVLEDLSSSLDRRARKIRKRVKS